MIYKEEFISYLRFEKRYSPHTIAAYENDLKQYQLFCKSLGFEDLDMSSQSIRLWIVSLLSHKISPRSVHRKLSVLSGFARFLISRSVISSNPADIIIKPRLRKRLPSFVEETKLNDFLDNFEFGSDYVSLRDRMIIETLYQTGIRRAELINLNISSLDLLRKQIKVKGKRNKERIIPLTDTLTSLYTKYLAMVHQTFHGNEQALFLTNSGQRIYPKLVYRVIHNFLSQVTTQEKKSPHILRHSFATHLLNKGADLNAIKELLGHANLSATQVYTHNSFEMLSDIYNKAHPRAK